MPVSGLRDLYHGVPGVSQVLLADGLFTPEYLPGPVVVVIADGTVDAVFAPVSQSDLAPLFQSEMPIEVPLCDLRPLCLAPGFIDLHVHGRLGRSFTTGTPADIRQIASVLPRTGVTSFMATISTAHPADTRRQVERVADAADEPCGERAEIVGIRLEGPFISMSKRGAQFAPGIRSADAAELAQLVAVSRGWVRMVDYAPEIDESQRFLSMLVELGVIASLGHTEATYDQAIRAISGGARHSAHLFNAMIPLGHREPGTVGALLTSDRATVEIIADGIHLHPAILKLVIRARGAESVALVTDAIAQAGMPDGTYRSERDDLRVSRGVARTADGTLAGSTLTLDKAVMRVVECAGVSWSSAIRMATLTPAMIAGVAARKGKITPGADADLIALDKDGRVRSTWVHGERVHNE